MSTFSWVQVKGLALHLKHITFLCIAEVLVCVIVVFVLLIHPFCETLFLSGRLYLTECEQRAYLCTLENSSRYFYGQSHHQYWTLLDNSNDSVPVAAMHDHAITQPPSYLTDDP